MNKIQIASEIRKLADELTDTFKCPECDTKVLTNTGYCVKCKDKVKEGSDVNKKASIDDGQRIFNTIIQCQALLSTVKRKTEEAVKVDENDEYGMLKQASKYLYEALDDIYSAIKSVNSVL